MKIFTGRIRSRLPDRGGLVQFTFELDRGGLLELRLPPQYPLPDPNEQVSVLGDLTEGVIQSYDIAIRRDSADKDIAALHFSLLTGAVRGRCK